MIPTQHKLVRCAEKRSPAHSPLTSTQRPASTPPSPSPALWWLPPLPTTTGHKYQPSTQTFLDCWWKKEDFLWLLMKEWTLSLTADERVKLSLTTDERMKTFLTTDERMKTFFDHWWKDEDSLWLLMKEWRPFLTTDERVKTVSPVMKEWQIGQLMSPRLPLMKESDFFWPLMKESKTFFDHWWKDEDSDHWWKSGKCFDHWWVKDYHWWKSQRLFLTADEKNQTFFDHWWKSEHWQLMERMKTSFDHWWKSEDFLWQLIKGWRLSLTTDKRMKTLFDNWWKDEGFLTADERVKDSLWPLMKEWRLPF